MNKITVCVKQLTQVGPQLISFVTQFFALPHIIIFLTLASLKTTRHNKHCQKLEWNKSFKTKKNVSRLCLHYDCGLFGTMLVAFRIF